MIVRPDLLDVLLLELAQLQNRPGWPVKKKKKKSTRLSFSSLARETSHFLMWKLQESNAYNNCMKKLHPCS